MSRITVRDVRATAENTSKLMRSVGYLGREETLVLIEKEGRYGIPYRLHTERHGQGGLSATNLLPSDLDGGTFLGWTAAEANRTLEIVNAGLLRLSRNQVGQILDKLNVTGSASVEKHES